MTVTDDAAGRIADTLQAVDLHAEAACIRVLLRDRTELRGVIEDEIAMSAQTAKTLRDLHDNWERIIEQLDDDQQGPLIENIVYWLIEDVDAGRKAMKEAVDAAS